MALTFHLTPTKQLRLESDLLFLHDSHFVTEAYIQVDCETCLQMTEPEHEAVRGHTFSLVRKLL
jgi:hypothetical protein